MSRGLTQWLQLQTDMNARPALSSGGEELVLVPLVDKVGPHRSAASRRLHMWVVSTGASPHTGFSIIISIIIIVTQVSQNTSAVQLNPHPIQL